MHKHIANFSLASLILSLFFLNITPLNAASSTSEEAVQKAYIAYYARPADPAGLNYWATRLDNEGGNINELINDFGNSDEYTQRFANLDNQTLVNNIYLNLFNRSADATGLSYYTNLLITAQSTLANISLDILNGAISDDQAIIDNKLTVANDYTASVSNGSQSYHLPTASTILTGVGASTPVSVVGRITAFGSVYVNGVRYEIDNATLSNTGPDGSKPLQESDLKIGMVVNLTGNRTGTTGIATSVSYNELLEAPVTAINLNSDGTGTITAGGQVINVSNTTVFYGESVRATITALQVGDWIEVSGYVGSNGSIDATMISYETENSHGANAELEGIISNLNTGAQTFTLNGIQVNYAAAIIRTAATLSNGMRVEVYGTLNTTNNSLAATFIEPEHSSSDLDDDYSDHNDDYNEGHEYELQGIVANASAGQFTLAGVTVRYTNTTRFSGLTAAQIQNGLFIDEVEGSYNAQGQFIAREIEVEYHSVNGVSDDHYASNELEVESTISAIDTASNTITVMGYRAAITASTVMKDDDQDDYYFNISSLSVGDYVEAILLKNADNSYTLRKLERENIEPWSSIEGTVSQVNADGSVVIGATTVTLPAGLTTAVGQRIEVEGTFDATTQTLQGVRFEYDD